jgi:cystathionine beta-synthase
MDTSLTSRARTSRVYDNILQTIGTTPLVRLPASFDPSVQCEILLKIEAMNPTGCVKSRIADRMVEVAEAQGVLKPGGTIVECTSGNTGVGLCMVAAVKGYRSVILMPDKMSQEKVDMLRAFGAEVILTPTGVPPEHPDHYLNAAKRVAKSIPGAWLSDQFENPQNPEAHYRATGPEIWQACEGQIDAFVGGCGTGGTLNGTAKYLKQVNPQIQVVGVDPPGSVYATFWESGVLPETGVYAVEGVGDDMIPGTWKRERFDSYEVVEDTDSFAMTRRLAAECGLFVGGSSGMAVVAGLRLARTLRADQRMVILLPDSGNRYLSKVYSDDWLKDGGFLPAVAAARATIADLARTRPRACLAASDDLDSALKHLTERKVEPIPVVATDPQDPLAEPVGIIDQQKLLRHLVAGLDLASLQADSCLTATPPILTPEAAWTELVDALESNPVVLIRDAEGLVGFTRNDLLASLKRIQH